jgi:hypothetical protein
VYAVPKFSRISVSWYLVVEDTLHSEINMVYFLILSFLVEIDWWAQINQANKWVIPLCRLGLPLLVDASSPMPRLRIWGACEGMGTSAYVMCLDCTAAWRGLVEICIPVLVSCFLYYIVIALTWAGLFCFTGIYETIIHAKIPPFTSRHSSQLILILGDLLARCDLQDKYRTAMSHVSRNVTSTMPDSIGG